MRSDSAPLSRCHRILIALHPRSFRQRHGAAAHRLFCEWVRAAGDGRTRRRRALRGIVQAFATLARAWAETLMSGGRRSGRAIASVASVAAAGARASARQWRQRPLQTAVVVATLAIAVGANTALFAVAEALLMRALPYEAADRVALVDSGPVASWDPERGSFRIDPTLTSLPGIESAALFTPGGAATIAGSGEARRARVASVDPGFFAVLGVQMPVGRRFLSEDEGRDVVVLSHALWMEAFAGDPTLVGTDLRLNGNAYTVIGIAPPEVSFPQATEVWLPTPIREEFFGGALNAAVAVRLDADSGIEKLNPLLAQRFAPALAEWTSRGYEMPPPRLISLRSALVRDVRQPLITLLAAAAVVFLLGCLNLAGVWLNQSLERSDELQLRRALGASRLRIFGQLVAETTTTGFMGGLAALLITVWATGLMAHRVPRDLPGVAAIGLGPTSVALMCALVVIAGVGFGGLAALRGVRLGARIARRGPGTPQSQRLVGGLVVLQGALALTLVVGALLMVRSFQSLVAVPLGFEPEGVLAFQVRVPQSVAASGAELRGYGDELERRLRALPGVTHVGLASTAPLSMEASYALRVRLPGQADEALPMAMVNHVSTEFFDAAGIPVLEGRSYDAGRTPADEIVIDEPLARTMFGDQPAVGRIIEQGQADGVEITWVPLRVRAVVGATHTYGPRNEPFPSIYFDLRQRPSASLGVVVRARGNAAALTGAVREAVLESSPDVAPYDLRTMRAAARDLVATDETLAIVGTGFSAAALLLAALGLYGLMAQHVTRGTHDFGVRIALGAVPARLVLTSVLRGVRLGLAAIALGLPAAIAATGLLRSRLYGIEPTDPLTIVVACGFVLFVSVLAAWVPARRIAAIDPRAALAAE